MLLFFRINKNRTVYFAETVIYFLPHIIYHITIANRKQRGENMSVKERILAIKLLEQQRGHKEFIKNIGLSIKIKKRPQKEERR